jgi:type IV pilus assembly protein PilY1
LFINIHYSLADDTELFIAQAPPDALILLDMSGSMNFAPAGPPYVSPPNRRIDIARNVLSDLLDDNDDGMIDSNDEKSLNIRLGYMRFRDTQNNDDNNPTDGTIRVLSGIGASYSDIWGKITDTEETNPVGGTPLAASLAEAKVYFERDINPTDPAIACRQKFIILITDGADTWACEGNGIDPASGDESSNPGMYKRRMLTVQKAKLLQEAGVKVFVVGFGGAMPDRLKRTLNWAAKYGGTDNPLEMNSGIPEAYDVTSGDPCAAADPALADPANYDLSGYAFLAEDASQLSKALKSIIKYIKEGAYSFNSPTVPSARIPDPNKEVIYLSSFTPSESPFWKGNLKAYRLNNDGTLSVDSKGKPLVSKNLWDPVNDKGAGEILKGTDPGARTILTYVGGAIKSFNQTNVSDSDLNLGGDTVKCNSECQRLVSYVRGTDTYGIKNTEDKDWKLGDIVHSNAVVVGEPSRFFEDEGFSGSGGFYQANKARTRVILVGSDDGMLHAFDAAAGIEKWAFIPNSLLKNLKTMVSVHTPFVDSSPKAADVWFYSSPTDSTKSVDEWKTVLICGLRKGGNIYFALDITDPLNPGVLWEFPKSTDASTLAKMGQSWPEPTIGRVKVEVGTELRERWVAFIGGGFDPGETRDKEATLGRALFVVDIKTGQILWEFSHDAQDGERKWMTRSIAAAPAAVDTNLDGFVDKVYMGDLGGQMWVFNVSFDEKNKKSNSQWTGKRLFEAPRSTTEKHPIYYQPVVAFDRHGIPWIYFGTGDREYPKDTSNPAERFYAVRDDGSGTYPRTVMDLSDVTLSNTFNQDPLKKGWTIQLEKSASKLEKVLGKPAVFNRLVYFTTYGYTDTADPCSVAGEARLYILEYLSGGGAFGVAELGDLEGTPSERSRIIGAGVPSGPILSVNMKGKASLFAQTTSGQVFSWQAFSSPSNKDILYWREVTR